MTIKMTDSGCCFAGFACQGGFFRVGAMHSKQASEASGVELTGNGRGPGPGLNEGQRVRKHNRET